MLLSFASSAEEPSSSPASLPSVPDGSLQRFEDEKGQTLYLSFDALSDGSTTYNGLSLSLSAKEVGAKELRLSVLLEAPSYKNCGSFSLKADGKKLKTLRPAESSSAEVSYGDGMGGFHFSSALFFSTKVFTTLLTAKKLQGSYCGISFTLTSAQQKSLSIFDGALRPSK